MAALCRDCCHHSDHPLSLCPRCHSSRLVNHPDLFRLSIAHIDGDAFYAAVEKRDRPALASRPVIVGGGRRGVVASCCYLARRAGVRSAMPLFRARALCPQAVVIAPDPAKYAASARRLYAMMEALTPLVQVLSIDEAVLDLRGTEAVHGAPPAVVLARFALAVERELGFTVSIGLAANPLMAKLAAERDKPRGMAVIGPDEAAAWLAPQPVSRLPGIGPVMARRLTAMGITTLGALAALTPQEARRHLGREGLSLVQRARGEDPRGVIPDQEAKSLSSETTFDTDIVSYAALEAQLWQLSEKLARRLAMQGRAAAGVTLKLKTAAFVTRSRATRLPFPSRLPEVLFAALQPLLRREADGTPFRLIGIGAAPVVAASEADRGDLADPEAPRRLARWQAIEALRARFGEEAVVSGRAWCGTARRPAAAFRRGAR